MDSGSGEIKECIEGFPNILETCGRLIMEKVSPLRQMPMDCLQQQTDVKDKLKELPHMLVSCQSLQPSKITVMCDSVLECQLMILLPGRIDIRIQEGCFWLQARGATSEVLGAKDVVGSSEKIGVSQQWYDELDNLTFSTPGLEMTVEYDNAVSDVKSKDKRVYIDCAVNTSPGTIEVITYAALYLNLGKHLDPRVDGQQKYAAPIADI